MQKVSILVPLYGAERYIEECAGSLFAQSYTNCEYIFVNDASVDLGLERLRVTIAEYPHLAGRIQVIDLPTNGGVAAARNRALDAASGDYILFVDADDWVDSEIVERLISKRLECDADICNAWCESVDQKENRVVTPMGWLGSPMRHLKAVLGQSHLVSNHVRGMLIRRSLFEDHNLRFTPGVDFGEDYSLLPQLLYYSKRLATLRAPLYFYRTENEGSYMNNISERHILNYVEAERIVSNFVESLPQSRNLQYWLMLGRLNIKKWIFRRGVKPSRYDKLLFGVESPRITNPLLWLYNRALDGECRGLILLLSVVVNLRLFIRTLLFKRA
ncbi:MAG: glycosyltransferase [Rikenellaceae bacterium]